MSAKRTLSPIRLIRTSYLVAIASLACAGHVHATSEISSTGFVLDPALPIFEDPLAETLVITGYDPVDISVHFGLPGGPALDEGFNNFNYPAARLGKFTFDPTEVATLFPVANSNNGMLAVSQSLTMAITDLDTNPLPGTEDEADYLDIIYAISLDGADDGSSLLRVLTNEDGGITIAPQFITGFGNQPLSADPDIATNAYDLTSAPVLGTSIAELFSSSGGEIWLYLIDTDDSGNNISLAKSLASDFSITTTFEPSPIPIPPAALLFGSAFLALLVARRQNA